MYGVLDIDLQPHPQTWTLGMKADAAGLTDVKPLVKYQLATISRAQESTYDKNLNHGKLAKVCSQQTVNYRSGGHGSCIIPADLIDICILKWNRNLLPLIGLEILPWTKILTLIIWPKSKVSGPWYIVHEVMALVYSCWSHRDTSSLWNINLLPLIELEIIPWTKILTGSSLGRLDVYITRTLYAPGRPRPWGHKNRTWAKQVHYVSICARQVGERLPFFTRQAYIWHCFGLLY